MPPASSNTSLVFFVNGPNIELKTLQLAKIMKTYPVIADQIDYRFEVYGEPRDVADAIAYSFFRAPNQNHGQSPYSSLSESVDDTHKAAEREDIDTQQSSINQTRGVISLSPQAQAQSTSHMSGEGGSFTDDHSQSRFGYKLVLGKTDYDVYKERASLDNASSNTPRPSSVAQTHSYTTGESNKGSERIQNKDTIPLCYSIILAMPPRVVQYVLYDTGGLRTYLVERSSLKSCIQSGYSLEDLKEVATDAGLDVATCVETTMPLNELHPLWIRTHSLKALRAVLYGIASACSTQPLRGQLAEHLSPSCVERRAQWDKKLRVVTETFDRDMTSDDQWVIMHGAYSSRPTSANRRFDPPEPTWDGGDGNDNGFIKRDVEETNNWYAPDQHQPQYQHHTASLQRTSAYVSSGAASLYPSQIGTSSLSEAFLGTVRQEGLPQVWGQWSLEWGTATTNSSSTARLYRDSIVSRSDHYRPEARWRLARRERETRRFIATCLVQYASRHGTFSNGIKLTLAFVFSILWKYRSHAIGTRRRSELKQPPGAVPLLGHLLVFARIPSTELYEYFEKCNNELGPIWTVSQPVIGRMIQCDVPEILEHVLKSNFWSYEKTENLKYAIGDLFGEGIFTSDGPQWRYQRKLASHIFTVKAFREYVSDVFVTEGQKVAEYLGKCADDGTVVDFHQLMLNFTLDSFGAVSFGESFGCLEAESIGHEVPFAVSFDRLTAICSERLIDPLWPIRERLTSTGKKAQYDKKFIADHALRLIQKRRQQELHGSNNKKDLLQLFMNARDDDGNPLSDDVMKDFILNFTIA
ncbi:hypothetical protein BGZ94_004115, partial [Podila epigama]